jgi:hypothetical protein
MPMLVAYYTLGFMPWEQPFVSIGGLQQHACI